VYFWLNGRKDGGKDGGRTTFILSGSRRQDFFYLQQVCFLLSRHFTYYILKRQNALTLTPREEVCTVNSKYLKFLTGIVSLKLKHCFSLHLLIIPGTSSAGR
jgi:hypothetical protein